MAIIFSDCQLQLNAKDADKIGEQLMQLKHKLEEDARKLFVTKYTNSNYLNDAKALMDDYHHRSVALQNKAHPKIILVPNDVLSIEELQIWLDLNADE